MDVSAFPLWRVPRKERWQPPLPDWRWAVPLFLLTLLTTTIIGARLQFNFAHHLPAYFTPDDLFPFSWVWHHPGTLVGGLSFSLPLMAILLCHELGHFLACRYYRLDASYPLFLPAPTLIGTFGAFIRIKAPFHDRQEVFDVGIAGPLAGMVVAIPVLIWGLATSFVLTPAQVTVWQHQFLEFAWPPLARVAAAWLHPGLAVSHIALSPMARAGWLGLFVTMLNLVPGAQLDGGHVLYAVAPRLHTAVSWITLAALLAGGWFYWPGWYFFAAFIAVMRVRHPFVPEFTPLGRGRGWLALLALAIFLATFMAMPLAAG